MQTPIREWLSPPLWPIERPLLHLDQSVGLLGSNAIKEHEMAKGQRKSNKEIRKPKKSAETKAAGLALPSREPVKAAMKKD
jgi:hypothetical protein